MNLAYADTPGPGQVDKSRMGPQLEAPIQRILYLRHDGKQQDHEVFPDPNAALLAELTCCDAVLYGMGSLYTTWLLLHDASGYKPCQSLHAYWSEATVMPDSSSYPGPFVQTNLND